MNILGFFRRERRKEDHHVAVEHRSVEREQHTVAVQEEQQVLREEMNQLRLELELYKRGDGHA